MLCPQCKTENRPDRAECYNCGQDLGTLRRVVSRARNLYNSALEHAERGRNADAIADLKNALELDASFIDAWVVLGTLYAREEQYDDAKEVWERAISLDKRLERAHSYLIKTEGIIPALPALRNLRIIAVVLALSLVASVGVLIVQSRPDPAMRKVIYALDLRKDDRSAEALLALDEGATLGVASPKAKRVARALQVQILDGFEKDVEIIRTLVDTGWLEAAIEKINSLAALSPPESVLKELETARANIGTRVVEFARVHKSSFDEGSISFANLSTSLDELAPLAEGSAAAEIAAIRAQATELYSSSTLATVRNQIMSAEGIRSAAHRANELTAENPAMAADIDVILAGRLAAEADARALTARDHLAKGETGPALRIASEVASLFEQLGKPLPEKLLAELKNDIRATRNKTRLATIASAHDAAEHEEVLRLLADAAPASWSPRDMDRLKPMREDAERAIAIATWLWSQEMDEPFENGTISRADARRMIDRHQLVLSNDIPGFSPAYKSTRTLFRTACAYAELDDIPHAKATMKRLRSEYPDSSLFKIRAVLKFEASLGSTE